MMKLYDNAFSPFARKVRLALEWKSIPHEVIDGLALANRDLLEKVNGRVEVPTLDHDGLIVVGSADICLYLERVSPTPRLYPDDHAEWVHARAWERCADTIIDPILINLSYWSWAERDDELPAPWLDAARRDLETVYAALERDLATRDFLCGELSIAELALFPHLNSTRSLGVGHDPSRHVHLHAWFKRIRAMGLFAADLERTRRFLADYASAAAHERRKIFWRGDRLEWVLARGFHRWLAREIEEDRVLFPGVGVPAARAVAR